MKDVLMEGGDFLAPLRGIVGRGHVITSPRGTRSYRVGYRFGSGGVLAVVRPANLVEQWRVFKACVNARKIAIVQAANTGLTGGSTPDGDDYDRDVVIISIQRVSGVHLINGGDQAICLSGTTLTQLERCLAPLGREPHSVLGSSCVGASVIGGICNNSGGALVQRGPAFTQLALYAKVNSDNEIELVNHLGIALVGDEETVLSDLEAGAFATSDVRECPARAASDREYIRRIRDIDSPTPARFNADPDRLFEASGSAGKVMVFAVRLDTFTVPDKTATFYVGTNDPDFLARLRRDFLVNFDSLPVTAEYMHRDCYDIARVYGKDSFLAIRALGTSRIAWLFAAKNWFDGLVAATNFIPKNASDRLLQALGSLFPEHLPRRMKEYRDRFEHYLLLKMEGDGIGEARKYFAQFSDSDECGVFECTKDEAERAFLHRFVAAGAAVRYRAVHSDRVADILSLDIALPRNARDWMEVLPDEVLPSILHRLYYGHFFCHVLHQDYVVAAGHDPDRVKKSLCRLLDRRGARYPAEHNVGHLYDAAPSQVAHFRTLDPRNCMNPGIGQTSKAEGWT